MSLKELLNSITHLSSGDFQKLISALNRLPGDDSIKQVNSTVLSVLPYIPTLERILGNGNIDKLALLASKIPDKESIDKLSRLGASLEKLPDKSTLEGLLKKADALEKLVNSLEG